MSYAILLCDDDPDIRTAMRRTLRGNEIIESGSPQQAIELMKTRPFDAIVSDFSLEADSDGLDLLQHVRVLYPDMIRFLVTGNKDIEVVVRAVNEGAVHRYFHKPWDDEKLRSALEIVLRSRIRD
ncbi:MAG: response regulator [Kofleriaceae bacterium]